MKRLAIFDFDGTLFNSIDDVIICFNKILTIYDLPTLTREDIIPCLGGNIDEIISLVLGENYTPKNLKTVKKTYLDLYNSSKKELTIPFPDAHEMLKELQDQNIILAINSNRLNYSLKEFVERYFSDIDFIAIEGQDGNHPSKPDPYGVNNIIKKADVNISEAIYIGDSTTDIKTAQNAEMDCLLVKWGYGLPEDYENDYPIDTVLEMSQIINYFK